jgi:hypothetical protein
MVGEMKKDEKPIPLTKDVKSNDFKVSSLNNFRSKMQDLDKE